MTGSEMNKLTIATMQVEALRQQLADAQAQIEALQRERDEAITAHRNIVKQFDELTCFIGCDYDPETETWVSGKPPYLSAGTNEVEACKAAVDALRSVAIVLQTALDAERKKAEVYRKALSLISVKTTPWFEGHHGTVEDILAAYAAYVLKQRTLPATPTERGENHSGDDTDMVQKGGGDGE